MEQVEQTAKRYKTISESTAFMVMLTLLSGYLNAYTYATRGGIFANMHTGNMSKLGISVRSMTNLLPEKAQPQPAQRMADGIA